MNSESVLVYWLGLWVLSPFACAAFIGAVESIAARSVRKVSTTR